jgi:hypothetical protein
VVFGELASLKGPASFVCDEETRPSWRKFEMPIVDFELLRSGMSVAF